MKSKDKIDSKTAAQIKEAREKKNLTQAEVAKLSSMTETYYAMTERGETNPSYRKLEKLAKALDIKITIKGN